MFTGKTFAIQLEDIPVSNGCFTGRNFSVNLGSVDTALAQNTTIFRSAISSNRIENTTASVLVLPSPSNECAQNTTSIYRLTFYTFLHNVLFRSTEQEKEGFKLGSIIISVGGNAIHLAEKLQFFFQVVKVRSECSILRQCFTCTVPACRMLKMLSLHNGLMIQIKLENGQLKAAQY